MRRGGFTKLRSALCWYNSARRSRLWPYARISIRPWMSYALLTPENFPAGDFPQLRPGGLQSGAAMTFAVGSSIRNECSAQGYQDFLPRGQRRAAWGNPLLDKPVFLAHGTQDSLCRLKKPTWGDSWSHARATVTTATLMWVISSMQPASGYGNLFRGN